MRLSAEFSYPGLRTSYMAQRSIIDQVRARVWVWMRE